MIILPRISFFTKLLSNYHYLNEVAVEGKKTNRFFFHWSHYDKYAAQIMRNGNCVTLLTDKLEINRENFWNPNYFENLTQHVFWTFNKSFLFSLVEKLETLRPSGVIKALELLNQNFVPYDKNTAENDEEMEWCLLKNSRLKVDDRFREMYRLDKENRAALHEALTQKVSQLRGQKTNSNEFEGSIHDSDVAMNFLSVLNPINGIAEETFAFIKSKLAEAEFDFDIFSKINKVGNNKNRYGLNGCIAAMIDFFYQKNYFKERYELAQLFQAYTNETGNVIAKLNSFLSEFRKDKSYQKHYEKLKQLKIDKHS